MFQGLSKLDLRGQGHTFCYWNEHADKVCRISYLLTFLFRRERFQSLELANKRLQEQIEEVDRQLQELNFAFHQFVQHAECCEHCCNIRIGEWVPASVVYILVMTLTRWPSRRRRSRRQFYALIVEHFTVEFVISILHIYPCIRIFFPLKFSDGYRNLVFHVKMSLPNKITLAHVILKFLHCTTNFCWRKNYKVMTTFCL